MSTNTHIKTFITSSSRQLNWKRCRPSPFVKIIYIVSKIKKVKDIYGWVQLSRDDGYYIKLLKKDVMIAIKKMGYVDDTMFDFRMEDNGESLFIN